MSDSKQPGPAVLMLRSGHHGGLGIARSLGRLGIPVYSADGDRWETAVSSRYCRGRFLFDMEHEQSVPQLLEIGRKLGDRPLLIPTTDSGAIWVAENAEALEGGYRFTRLDPNLVRTLCDKGRMQQLAQRCGMPVARSIVPQNRADIERFTAESVFPLMVKATHTERMRSRTGGTKFIVQTTGELLDLYLKTRDSEGPNFLVQELIPGEDWMFDGYFDNDSRCVFGITGKKIRRFPAKTGVTSLGVCLRNESVHSVTREFMKAIGYRGILDIGYRYDWRDGQYKVMDVNPRIGCTFRLFAGAGGMDVARALYLSMTGRTVPAAPAVEGRKWIVEDFDVLSTLRSLRDGGFSIKEWMKSFAGIEEAACFAADDPMPLLMIALSNCFELSKWLRRRLAVRKDMPRAEQPALMASTRRR